SGMTPDETTLAAASGKSWADTAKKLITAGAVPAATTILNAIKNAEYEEDAINMLRVLTAKGAVPDATTLTTAIRQGWVDAASLLIKAGAAPTTAMFKDALDAYEYDEDAAAMVGLLIKRGAVPDTAALDAAA